MCASDIFLVIISIIFPPFGVWVKRGICSADSLINIALCILGWLPGLLHAWYIIFTYPDEYEHIAPQDPEYASGGHVTYYYVQGEPAPRRQPPPPGGRPQHQGRGPAGSAPGAQFPGQQSGTVNSFAQPPAPQQQAQAQAGSSGGPREDIPPSYADAVKGDNKVQN